MKISGDIFFNLDLKWPNYGTKFSISYALFMIGWGTFGLNANVVLSKDMEISPSSKEIIFLQATFLFSLGKSKLKTNWCNIVCVPTYILHCQPYRVSAILSYQYFFTLFCMAWLEIFGSICITYSTESILGHTKRCLYLFQSLQNGLGISVKYNKT